MSEEKQSLQQQADRARPSSRKPVLVYLVILFAAAFVLLLLAFFMQKRANDVAIDNLEQTSHSAAESLENLVEERDALKEEAARLQNELEWYQNLYFDTINLLEETSAEYEETQSFYSLLKLIYVSEILAEQRQYEDAAALLEQWNSSQGSLIEAVKEYTMKNESDPIDISTRFQNLISTLQGRGYLPDLQLENDS